MASKAQVQHTSETPRSSLLVFFLFFCFFLFLHSLLMMPRRQLVAGFMVEKHFFLSFLCYSEVIAAVKNAFHHSSLCLYLFSYPKAHIRNNLPFGIISFTLFTTFLPSSSSSVFTLVPFSILIISRYYDPYLFIHTFSNHLNLELFHPLIFITFFLSIDLRFSSCGTCPAFDPSNQLYHVVD